jgi:hypothetical protein
MRYLIALLLLTGLAGCGSLPARERLNGTWDSDFGPYTFDAAAGTMTREISSGPETKPYTVESETADSVTFRTDGEPIVITFRDDGTATMVQKGKLPLVLTRRT